jgi:hypothetical protein
LSFRNHTKTTMHTPPDESTDPAEAIADRKINFIARQAADVLQTKIEDSSAKLLAAIAEHEEANQHSETPKPFSLGFTVKIDWAGNKAVYTFSFSTKYKDESAKTLPDPNQRDLFDEHTEGGEA